MSILIDKNTNLLVQGITGRQALMNTLYMREYGTRVLAGTRPGKGGQFVSGIPIYDTVQDAKNAHPELNASAVYVPRGAVKDAAIEAINAGIKLVVIISERTPHQDLMEIAAYADKNNARVVGPNSIGIISPEKSVIGLIGARVSLANQVFKKGNVGVISRSGGQVTTCCHYLSRVGIGQTTALCVGGDAFVGTKWVDLLKLFEEDDETKAVIGYGEIGTEMEEETAELIKSGGFSKPFIAYIAGKHAGAGQRFGHAGAIIKGDKGNVAYKRRMLCEAGATVVDHFHEIVDEVKSKLQIISGRPTEKG